MQINSAIVKLPALQNVHVHQRTQGAHAWRDEGIQHRAPWCGNGPNANYKNSIIWPHAVDVSKYAIFSNIRDVFIRTRRHWSRWHCTRLDVRWCRILVSRAPSERPLNYDETDLTLQQYTYDMRAAVAVYNYTLKLRAQVSAYLCFYTIKNVVLVHGARCFSNLHTCMVEMFSECIIF